MLTAIDRVIVSHHRDETGARVLRLDCGHPRHVVHKPPRSSYPWADDDAACDARIGERIECLRCGQRQLPEGAAAYKRTKTFDERSTPKGLRGEHRTAPGVWGRLVVESGGLCVAFAAPLHERAEAMPNVPVLIPPELPHHVELTGPVQFHVEFLRARPTAEAG